MAHTCTKQCLKCLRDIRANNFAKHSKTCSGPRVKKIRGIDFDPNCGYANGSRTAWNKGLDKTKNDSILKASETLKNRYKSKELKPSGYCSEEWIASGKSADAVS